MSVTLLAVANALQKQHKEGKVCLGHSLRVQPILEGKSQGTRRLVTWCAQSGRNERSAQLLFFPILGLAPWDRASDSAFRVGLPSSVKALWKLPRRQSHPKVCDLNPVKLTVKLNQLV